MKKVAKRTLISTARLGRKVRKYLNADSLITVIGWDSQNILDGRGANSKITLDDVIMLVFAIFYLKDQLLLAFDKGRSEEDHNFCCLYGLSNIPYDSLMRTILAPLPLSCLRTFF